MAATVNCETTSCYTARSDLPRGVFILLNGAQTLQSPGLRVDEQSHVPSPRLIHVQTGKLFVPAEPCALLGKAFGMFSVTVQALQIRGTDSPAMSL